MVQPTVQLREKIRELEERLKAFGGMTGAQLSGLQILQEISARTPPSITLNVNNLAITTGTTELGGSTESYDDVVKLKNALGASPFFPVVNMTDTRTEAGNKISFRLNINTSKTFREDPMNFWQTLQTRERLFIGGAGAALVLFLIFKLAIDPLFKHSSELDRQIVTARRQLAELRTMQQEYQRQKSVVDSINSQLKRQQNFAIVSRLEELARQTGIQPNKILSMRQAPSTPSEMYNEESIEVKMDGVTLEQLVRYLYQIENSPQLLKIKRLDIKPHLDNRQLLNTTFRVSAFTLKEGIT